VRRVEEAGEIVTVARYGKPIFDMAARKPEGGSDVRPPSEEE